MLKIENVQVMGFEHAIRGMRNPMNSWDKSDSGDGCSVGFVDRLCSICDRVDQCHMFHQFRVGLNDYELMLKLAKAGPVQAKYRRMIVVYMDITAPLYWWKEFDTYKVGTVANSCSTMHKIQDKEFTLDDFSHEHIISDWIDGNVEAFVEFDNGIQKTFISPKDIFNTVIDVLNASRDAFLKSGDKRFWWQMIQLLPSSYNQRRTVMLNYEVLAGLYPMRKDHKLDEWREFCGWIEQLPYHELITVGKE